MAGERYVRTEHRRMPERGSHDRSVIDAILDEALFCHVGFTDVEGHPVVVPTIHVRVRDHLVLHGSPASRLMRTLASGSPVSIAATLFDGLVLARSVFNHSMNYRSVVLFGSGTRIDDPEQKWEAMRVFTEKILPGRWEEARQPSDKEFRGTLMVSLPIEAASAKVRTGPPGDEPEDAALPVWAGVIPYSLRPGRPVPAPDVPSGMDIPASVRAVLGG